MRATLLCLGPGLNLYGGNALWPVIGLKRAATVHRCDWWAVLDSPCLRTVRPIGSPQLLTRREYRPKHTTLPGVDVETLAEWCAPLPVGDFTAVAALALAGWLGATRIDVYGADWTDAPDWDGVTPDEMNRGEQRWQRERGQWAAMVAWLNGRGVQVRRIGHE